MMKTLTDVITEYYNLKDDLRAVVAENAIDYMENSKGELFKTECLAMAMGYNKIQLQGVERWERS